MKVKKSLNLPCTKNLKSQHSKPNHIYAVNNVQYEVSDWPMDNQN